MKSSISCSISSSRAMALAAWSISIIVAHWKWASAPATASSRSSSVRSVGAPFVNRDRRPPPPFKMTDQYLYGAAYSADWNGSALSQTDGTGQGPSLARMASADLVQIKIAGSPAAVSPACSHCDSGPASKTNPSEYQTAAAKERRQRLRLACHLLLADDLSGPVPPPHAAQFQRHVNCGKIL